jgi:uncharacterized Zn finger protein
MELTKVECPVCYSGDVEFACTRGWRAVIVCNECGFEFRADPIQQEEEER